VSTLELVRLSLTVPQAGHAGLIQAMHDFAAEVAKAG
jgi:hypothetical protein